MSEANTDLDTFLPSFPSSQIFVNNTVVPPDPKVWAIGLGSMSVNLQRLGRDKEAIARVWSRRSLGECADHFPLSPQQDPELSGRRDSGYADGGNTLIMFTDMGGVI